MEVTNREELEADVDRRDKQVAAIQLEERGFWMVQIRTAAIRMGVDVAGTVGVASLHQIGSEVERLKAENKRFREAGHRLEAALDAIDTSLMSEQALAADTKAVGGPVSDYSISYDEQAVVNRVAAEVERLKEVEDTASAAFKTVSDQIQEVERLTASNKNLHEKIEIMVSAQSDDAHDWKTLHSELDRLKAMQNSSSHAYDLGLERAAVIADTHHMAGGKIIAAAIRAEVV